MGKGLVVRTKKRNRGEDDNFLLACGSSIGVNDEAEVLH